MSKMAKTAKLGNCDAHFSRLWERLKLIWTSQGTLWNQLGAMKTTKKMSGKNSLFSNLWERINILGYLMEPIRDNEDFKGAIRNVKMDVGGR